MVSRDTVRGADGKITKADGATPYDPAAPSDARRIEGDLQALMFLKHPLGETFQREPAPQSLSLACAGPQCAQSVELAIEEGATSFEGNVTFVPSGPLPVAAGRGTLIVTDAAGEVVYQSGEQQVLPGPTPTTLPVSIPLDGAVGPLTLELRGDGAFSVTFEGTVTYVDHPFLVITWNEPTLG